jgi:hypothetical protein
MAQHWYQRFFSRRQETIKELRGGLMVGSGFLGEQGYMEITISSWTQLRETFEDHAYRSWAFRGQTNSKWSLYSSLSRHLQAFRVRPEY